MQVQFVFCTDSRKFRPLILPEIESAAADWTDGPEGQYVECEPFSRPRAASEEKTVLYICSLKVYFDPIRRESPSPFV
jgi:hypothetical protein